VEPGDAGSRLVGFVVQRLLRVGSAALVLVLLGEFLLPGGGAWQPLVWAGAAVALWTPTTLLLFQARFLGTAPSSDGGADDPEEDPAARIRIVRALTAEHVVGSVPLAVASVFAIARLGAMGVAVGVLALALIGRKLVSSAVTMERHVAALEREQGRWEAAVDRLGRLERAPLATVRDRARSDLAQTLQLAGRIDEAVAALERIDDPASHRVPAKLARLVVAADPDRALALASSGELDVDDQLAIHVLAQLHRGEGHVDTDLVERLREAVRDPGPARGLLSLLLGASLARRQPEAAQRALSDAAWTSDDLPWLQPLWPGVATPLADLSSWTATTPR